MFTHCLVSLTFSLFLVKFTGGNSSKFAWITGKQPRSHWNQTKLWPFFLFLMFTHCLVSLTFSLFIVKLMAGNSHKFAWITEKQLKSYWNQAKLWHFYDWQNCGLFMIVTFLWTTLDLHLIVTFLSFIIVTFLSFIIVTFCRS